MQSGMKKRVAIIGEFDPLKETHLATNAAIEHSLKALDCGLQVDWVSTEQIATNVLAGIDGMWISPGSPYMNMRNALKAIRFARENRVPCLGTCGGFQHIMIEYAQAFLEIEEPGHEEYDPESSTLFISELACSLRGKEMKLSLSEDSKIFGIYGAAQATEKYYCNFGINPGYVDAIKAGPIDVVGSGSEGEIRIVEYPDHPFMIATLFVPQARSVEGKPHPLVTEFVRAIMR